MIIEILLGIILVFVLYISYYLYIISGNLDVMLKEIGTDFLDLRLEIMKRKKE